MDGADNGEVDLEVDNGVLKDDDVDDDPDWERGDIKDDGVSTCVCDCDRNCVSITAVGTIDVPVDDERFLIIVINTGDEDDR